MVLFISGCSPQSSTAAPATATTAPASTIAPTKTPTITPTTAPTIAFAVATKPNAPANPEIIVATTTSTQDSGLLDVLAPLFEKQTGYKVKTIAVGTGQALSMGEKGEADVLLVHAPDSEKTFMQGNNGTRRRLVMHNDFIILGPAADPAKIKDVKEAAKAMTQIASSKATFASRGDNSGTNQLELKLWKMINITPKGQSWYLETGQGMGATLNVASEKNSYTISDRATYLANKAHLASQLLVEGDPLLLNIYHVIEVNPAKSTKINAVGGTAFADFMVAPETQKVISEFGKDKYGQALFFPDAGKPDDN
ncbi:MAG: tungsten ABC transporter substrate-binding protein [Chloroflexi bacterium]|nr:tungsten ABC transporter substrate-binding protein [Chloroflexota bacterium]